MFWNGTGDGTGTKPEHWYGDYDDGEDYADYYLAAVKRIRSSTYAYWEKLKIIGGGSVQHHGSLKWPANGTFGSSGQFMTGFIDRVKDEAENDDVSPIDYLPDWMAIHAYSYTQNPEGGSDGTVLYPITESRERIQELFDLDKSKDYLPNISITEYGFSPDVDRKFSPNSASALDEINPNTYTQAVYFLRSLLIQSFAVADLGISWIHTNYLHHPKNDPLIDTGFYDQSTGFGKPRYIHNVAQEVFSSTSTLKLNDSDSKLWVPFQTANYLSSTHRKAWCGWETDVTVNSEPTRWCAFWVYKYQNEYYKPQNPVTASFKITGNYDDPGYTYRLYRMNFDLSPVSMFEDITDANDYEVSYSLQNDETTIEIDITTENPIFVKITKH